MAGRQIQQLTDKTGGNVLKLWIGGGRKIELTEAKAKT
jgi:hypothetical protein